MLSRCWVILVGILILFAGSLGVSPAGRVTIKAIHVWFGYAMTLNLLWRFVWAFLGNKYARWKAILPGGPGYLAALDAYASAFVAGRPKRYLGHNPIGRLAGFDYLPAARRSGGVVFVKLAILRPATAATKAGISLFLVFQTFS